MVTVRLIRNHDQRASVGSFRMQHYPQAATKNTMRHLNSYKRIKLTKLRPPRNPKSRSAHDDEDPIFYNKLQEFLYFWQKFV